MSPEKRSPAASVVRAVLCFDFNQILSVAAIQRGHFVGCAWLCSRFLSYWIGARAYLTAWLGQQELYVQANHGTQNRAGEFSVFSETEFSLSTIDGLEFDK